MRAAVYAPHAPQNVVVALEKLKPAFEPERRHRKHVFCRVLAAGVNPVDAKAVVADKLPESCVGLARRAVAGRTVGFDFSGVVVGVGAAAAAQFAPGDAVYGCMPPLQGTFCDFVVAPMSQIAHKPTSISRVEAAALPIPIVTTVQAMRAHGCADASVRQNVLVIGASGGVGIVATQVAKAYGNDCVAVCSAKNAELVQSLGADRVVKYDTDPDTIATIKSLGPYDFVFDTVSSHDARDNAARYKDRLTASPSVLRDAKSHAYVTIGGPTSYWVRALAKRWLGWNLFSPGHDHHWIRFPGCADDLAEARRLVDEASVRPRVAEAVPLTDDGVQRAFAAMHARRAVGKFVVDVSLGAEAE